MRFEFTLNKNESTELIRLIDSELGRKSSDATEENAKSIIKLHNLKSKVIGINEKVLYRKFDGRKYRTETLVNLSDYSDEKIHKLEQELSQGLSLNEKTSHDDIIRDIINKKIDQEKHLKNVIKSLINNK